MSEVVVQLVGGPFNGYKVPVETWQTQIAGQREPTTHYPNKMELGGPNHTQVYRLEKTKDPGLDCDGVCYVHDPDASQAPSNNPPEAKSKGPLPS